MRHRRTPKSEGRLLAAARGADFGPSGAAAGVASASGCGKLVDLAGRRHNRGPGRRRRRGLAPRQNHQAAMDQNRGRTLVENAGEPTGKLCSKTPTRFGANHGLSPQRAKSRFNNFRDLQTGSRAKYAARDKASGLKARFAAGFGLAAKRLNERIVNQL